MKNPNILIIGGTWDDKGGKPSYFVSHIQEVAEKSVRQKVVCLNGGKMDYLNNFLENFEDAIKKTDVLLWMPNIDNEEDKILPMIKKKYNHLILIQSKRVIEKNYTDLELNKRLLASHSALGLIIKKIDSVYTFSVIDPLGNVWCEHGDVESATKALFGRAYDMMQMSRMQSKSIGPEVPIVLEPKFIEAVTTLGKEFDEVITAINPERYLGNASTRCCHGFPSARGNKEIYVSKRNVDKTIIDESSFVKAKLWFSQVQYFGDNKPSVDTPIQILLYNHYPNVNYMVHGHCYVEGAPFTTNNIPCGFLEEVFEIQEVMPDSTASNFVINLKGHGCLIMANDIDYLTSHQFNTRPFLEAQ